MTEAIANHPCWKFALELYAKPGVSQACLLLQDRLGVDVSLLLTTLFYAEHRGVELPTEAIAALDRSVAPWRAEVIVPLRQLRRRLKGGGLLAHPTDEFYRRIKADELLAEQIEIGALARQLEQMSGNISAAGSTQAVIERVVKHFADNSSQRTHLLDTEIQGAVAILHSSAY
jgi:uncharacterized protein (TIGR02444 family)